MLHSMVPTMRRPTATFAIGYALRVMLQAAVIAQVTAATQTTSYHCVPKSAVREALLRIRFFSEDLGTIAEQEEWHLNFLRSLVQEFPDDLFAHRRYLDFIKRRYIDQQDKLIEEYKGPPRSTFRVLKERAP